MTAKSSAPHLWITMVFLASKQAKARRIVRYFAPYFRQWIVILLCVIVIAGIGVLPPLCIRAILDRAIPHQDLPLLSLLVGAIVIINVVDSLLTVLQSYLSTRIGQNITAHLRLELFERLQAMSVTFYSQTRSGEIISRVNNDVNAVQNTVTSTFVNIVSNLLTTIVTLVVIFTLSWRVALIILVAIPFFVLPLRFIGRLSQRLTRETQEKQAELTVFLQERLHFSGMLLSKTFGQESATLTNFARHSREVADLNTKQALVGQGTFLIVGLSAASIPALIYFYGGRLAIQGELSMGSIIALVTYLTNLYRPLYGLASIYVDLKNSMAVFGRIFEFLDLRPEVVDKPDALSIQEVKGHVRFENVCFSYSTSPSEATLKEDQDDAKTAFALNDVSFEMLPGERVALVGPSGAGKTTITYLLPRFLDPKSGHITLDGRRLSDLSQESLRAQIGVVTQETFLFHASVRDNLLYARPEATERQIIQAAQAAQIHDFIQNLPQGYDTVVGERAFRLSGGERQRLAIARALLKDPRILILDEATSHLDATSEHLVQQALETLLEGRTSLIIAHRLATISRADKILVLDQGHLVESGHHAELLANGGLYASLYNLQFHRKTDPITNTTGHNISLSDTIY